MEQTASFQEIQAWADAFDMSHSLYVMGVSDLLSYLVFQLHLIVPITGPCIRGPVICFTLKTGDLGQKPR